MNDLIRLGRDFDGGYVVSERSIAATRTLIGLGINDDWSFEEDVAARVSEVGIIMVDGSVSRAVFRKRALNTALKAVAHGMQLRRWYMLDNLQKAKLWWSIAGRFGKFISAPNRTFHQRFIGADPGMIRWHDVMASVPESVVPDVFVKMDIEGAEYDVLHDQIQDAHRIAGMAIEFHDCGVRWHDFVAAMQALSGSFAVVHIHGNNYGPLIPNSDVPDVLEVTVVNRTLLPATLLPSMASYPLAGLDRPNDKCQPDYALVFSPAAPES